MVNSSGRVALAQPLPAHELLHAQVGDLALVQQEERVPARLLAAWGGGAHDGGPRPQTGSMWNSGCPYCTVAPFSTRISRTTPPTSAVQLVHHLHHLEDAERLAGLDLVADLDEGRRLRRRASGRTSRPTWSARRGSRWRWRPRRRRAPPAPRAAGACGARRGGGRGAGLAHRHLEVALLDDDLVDVALLDHGEDVAHAVGRVAGSAAPICELR